MRLTEGKGTAVKRQNLRFFHALEVIALKRPEFVKSGAFSNISDWSKSFALGVTRGRSPRFGSNVRPRKGPGMVYRQPRRRFR